MFIIPHRNFKENFLYKRILIDKEISYKNIARNKLPIKSPLAALDATFAIFYSVIVASINI
jgi:hypothetical protein